MDRFPDNPEEFYRLRDDRTNRYGIASSYQETHCAVVIDSSGAQSLSEQTMLAVSCNLLSRWCRKVTIVGGKIPPHAKLGSRHESLQDMILEQMRSADPFGQFSAESVLPSGSDAVLFVGDHESDIQGLKIFINASGWLCSTSGSGAIPLSGGHPDNALGAVAAACLGVAQIFKHAVRGRNHDASFQPRIFDLFALSYTDQTNDSHQYAPSPALGNLLMIGAGSIGSAAVYCLRMINASGKLVVVDRDRVKIENFNRSPIFGREHFGSSKAKTLVDYLTGTDLQAGAYDGWWNDFLREIKRAEFNFDVWLPLANEYGVRSAMQNNLPPLMIHASTTANWGVNHARHIPGRDDCLIDRFPDAIPQDRLMCSTGSVVVEQTPLDAALPFLSFFGGLMIVSDLVRLQLPGYPQVPNFALFDFDGPLMELQKFEKKPDEKCICKSQGKALHTQFNGKTRYWNLCELGFN